jgi:hypothetical protein
MKSALFDVCMGALQLASRAARAVVRFSLFSPLVHVYLKGPRAGSLGFWQGADPSTICYELTGVDTLFWRENPAKCDEIVLTKIVAFVTGMYALFFLWASYSYLSLVWHRHYIVSPLNARIDRMLEAYDVRLVPRDRGDRRDDGCSAG